MNTKALSAAFAVLPLCTLVSSLSLAQQSGPVVEIEEVAVVGTRRAGRTSFDAPVPVDVLSGAEIQAQGSSDILDVLTNIVPSYNANREPISDAGTLVRPANLRGMPSDNTLVLVNGKRRHRGAVIGEFIAGINKGAQGVDLSPLPGIAMKQVEVLRDGAAAQYGSDAIAGVINFALSDDAEARRINVQTGEYFEGDGAITEISGLFGTSLGDSGFATLAFETKETDPTSRGIQDPGAANIEGAPNPVVVWGTPIIEDDHKLIFNSAVESGENAEFYAFGNYATRKVDGSFFYRNPNNRGGVFTQGSDRLIADLTPDGSGACGNDDAALASALTDPNCFAFNELFPGGFTPRFGGTVVDTSFFIGYRGEWSNGMTYDVSASNGSSKLSYRINNTVNASYGPDTPTDFNLGSQKQTERLFNADFSYPLDVGFASDLNVAFGFQIHKEEFEIAAGQTESFAPGGYEDQGFSIGSNGFQGFSSDVAGVFKRDSQAAYLDLEADITDNFLVSTAARFEDFSDFGSTFDGKLALRYDLTDSLAFRSAFSTGFKAPTSGQSSLRRAATSFQDGELIEVLVVPPTNDVAEFFGGGQLEPEESTSFTFGTVLQAGIVDITVDYFEIEVENRIALTDQAISETDRAALVAQGNVEANTISQIQFFVNDFDTKTKGIDVIATMPVEWAAGNTNVTLAYNMTDTKVTNRGGTVSAERARELEDFLPQQRATLTLNHAINDWSINLRTNYYGETFENLFNDTTLPVTTPALILVDLEVSNQVTDVFNVAVGAKNLFDTYPDEWSIPQADGSEWTGNTPGFLGAIYPLNSPAGMNGGYYYLRVSADF